MKLIQCHIENFGRLTNFDFNFVAGLNNIKEPNGWGKSTFATFIKAMFYGLPATAKRDLDANERKKYQPWQGGNYGGNLVFEMQQKQYKIERFFGKNKSEDTFNLIDLSTNKKSKVFTENVGEEIFGLDEEAFERSSYLPQKILDSNLNESMAQKLTNLVQGTTENFDYEKALASLDKKRANLSNNKKTGQIQILESKIEDKLTQVRELENNGQVIPTLQNQVNEKDKAIIALVQKQNQIKTQINTYSQLQQKRANQELYAELNRRAENTQKEIQIRQDILNHHQTNLTEIDNYLNADKALTSKEDEIKIKSSNDYVQQRYQTLTDYFGGNVPTVEATNTVYQDILQYNTLKAKTTTGTARSKSLSGRQWLCLGLLITAILCALVGGLTFTVQRAVAITLFVFGGIILLVAGYLYLINLINVKTSTPQNFDLAKQQKDQIEILRLQKNILAFLNQYETHSADYLVAINTITANLHEYKQLQTQIARNADAVNELSKTVATEQNLLAKYLAQFKFTDATLSRAEKLLTLKQTLLDLANLNQQLVSVTQELEQFKKDKHFDITESDAVVVDINELQQNEKALQNQIDVCRDEKSQIIARINQIQNNLAALGDIENEKVDLQNELKTLQQEFTAVKSAMKYLQAANESLSSQFLAPMKNGLRKYLTMIADQKFDNLNLDTDFNITFEEYGKAREVDYYSKGYQNLIDLCMRLALIDALYDKEKPFIVLDDPLINLDEAKIDKAKQFLQTLSADHQLIYFSCHASRC